MSKSTTKIGSIGEFIERINGLKGNLLLYRGLSNENWDKEGVEAAAYRRIKRKPEIFQDCIKDLLAEAKQRAFSFGHRQNKELNDLELLAELQHNGAATCLIDFTTNPLIALWFACKEHPDKDGKVVAVPTDDPEKFKTVTSDIIEKEDKIEILLKGDTLYKWQPWDINNRIIAQQSTFILGKPNIEKNYYKEITVPNKIKNDLLKDLEKLFGISETTLFRDLPGFSLANAHDKEYIPPNYFAQGLNKHQSGNFEGAIVDYNKAIALNQNKAFAYYNRGLANKALGNIEEAIKDYDQAIKLNPKNAKAYNNRGNAKYYLGDYEGAIADYDEAIRLDKHYTIAYYCRGNAKRALENYKEAIKDYDKAIKLKPDYAKAYNNRGNAKSYLGDYEGAITDYGYTIKLEPKNAVAHYNRGNAKRTLGNHEGAIADYNEAIRLDPKYANAYDNRGLAKKALGNTEEAEKDFAKAKKLRKQTD